MSEVRKSQLASPTPRKAISERKRIKRWLSDPSKRASVSSFKLFTVMSDLRLFLLVGMAHYYDLAILSWQSNNAAKSTAFTLAAGPAQSIAFLLPLS